MNRTPNYVLITSFIFDSDSSQRNSKVLPAGSFARPIVFEYVPRHVIEDPRWKLFSDDLDVFCYTRYGIISIPKSLLRED